MMESTTMSESIVYQPFFDMPNFIQITSEKLGHYLIVAQRSMYELQQRHSRTDLVPYYETAEREWKADPINNPTTFPPTHPLTVEKVEEFYKRCDDICCHASSSSNTTLECVPPKTFLFQTFLNHSVNLIQIASYCFCCE